jgi:putative oxidoreductase
MATTNTRLYNPALGSIYEAWSPLAEWLLRGGVGIILLVHGAQKFLGMFGGSGMGGFIGALEKFGYPSPVALGYFVATVETLIGIAFVIGLFVRPAALALVIFMLFAVHYTVNTGAHPFVWFRGGSELSIVYLLIGFYFMIHGAGAWSLDRKQAKEF